MPTYIHELKDWPQFKWGQPDLTQQLASVRHRQGRLLGRMEGLGFKLRAEATLRTLTEEVVTSSEIEGENLDRHARNHAAFWDGACPTLSQVDQY